MNRETIAKTLKDYIVRERLSGDDSEFDESTPLLTWGILDSLSIVEFVSFTESLFSISVPKEQITARNFETLAAIISFVLMLVQSRPEARTLNNLQ
jgi:acyl carrier protein